MTKAFKKVLAGLKDARSHAQGTSVKGLVVHKQFLAEDAVEGVEYLGSEKQIVTGILEAQAELKAGKGIAHGRVKVLVAKQLTRHKLT